MSAVADTSGQQKCTDLRQSNRLSLRRSRGRRQLGRIRVLIMVRSCLLHEAALPGIENDLVVTARTLYVCGFSVVLQKEAFPPTSLCAILRTIIGAV